MPESEHTINRTDAFFRGSLKSGAMMPPEHVWNNIERKILLGERKKMNGKIVLLRWSVAASIAMLFLLGVYMWDIYTENKKLKHELALRNKDSYPEINNAQFGTTDNGQLHDSKDKIASGEISKSISENNIGVTADKINMFSEGALNKNIIGSEIQTQDNQITNNNNNLSADNNATETYMNSLSDSLIQSKGLLSDTSSAPTTLVLNSLDNPDKTEKQSTSTWWIGAFYSPDYTYQNFLLASDNSNAKKSGALYVNAAHPKYSYSTGLQAGFWINEKWSFQTGLLYSDKGEKTDYKLVDTLISNANVTASINDPVFNSVDKNYTVNYKYEYFDMPLLIKYQRRKSKCSKLSYFVSAGLSANFFFRYQVVTESIAKGSKQTTTENPALFKSINYSTIASIGIEYSFSKKISMNLEPTFRHAFTSAVKNSILNTYPYSLGMVTGFKYHF